MAITGWDQRAHINLGNLYSESGNTHEAIKQYKFAITVETEGANLNLGTLLAKLESIAMSKNNSS